MHVHKRGPLLDAHTELHATAWDVLVRPFCSIAGALCRKDVELAAWQRPQPQRESASRGSKRNKKGEVHESWPGWRGIGRPQTPD